MRTFFIVLTCAAFAGWSMWARYHYTCKISGLCGESPDTTEIAGDLDLVIDGKKVLEGFQQFSYDTSAVDPGLTENNQKFISAVADYMKANPAVKLKVAGTYLPEEEFKGILENIGLARADKIRNMLMEQGISADRLDIDSDPVGELAEWGKPLRFSGTTDKDLLAELNADNPDANNAENENPDGENPDGENPDGKDPEGEEEFEVAKFTFEDMTYSDQSFEKGKYNFVPVPNFVNYADTVAKHLALYPEKSMTIIGYTDSDGTDEYNMTLGLNRAKSVRTYFMQTHKVDGKKISTESEGENKPVAPNDTEANMAKNRRVRVVINQ